MLSAYVARPLTALVLVYDATKAKAPKEVKEEDDEPESEEEVEKRVGYKKVRRPLSEILKVLAPDVVDEYKRRRVEEIMEHCVRGVFTHKSDAQVTKLRAMLPQEPKPAAPVFSVPVELGSAVVTAGKLSGLISSKLLGADAGSGKVCAVYDFGTAPLQVTSDAGVAFIRAPVFVKGNEAEGLQKGRPATMKEQKRSGLSSSSTSAAATAQQPALTAAAPAAATAPVAKATPRGSMKPGNARGKMQGTASAGAGAVKAKAAAAAAVQPAKKAKKEDLVQPADWHAAPLPTMDEYWLRHGEPDSSASRWIDFRKALGLEQHMNGITRRAQDAAEQSVISVIRPSQLCSASMGEASQVLDAACMAGGAVVRSLRIGAVQGEKRIDTDGSHLKILLAVG
jgi:hypothetical protein